MNGQVKQIDRVVSQFLQEEEAGKGPDPGEWLARYPHLRTELEEFFSNHHFLNEKGPEECDGKSTISFKERRTSGEEKHGGGPDFIRPGEVIGDCCLVRKLGQGGMGIVYLGKHVRLCNHRAVKLLPNKLVTDGMITRFWREARIAASICHPNVINVHDVGKDRDRHYIVMEYIEGQNLAQLLQSERDSLKELSWQRIFRLLAPVIEALHVIHQRDIVHRDIKPSNIMVTRPFSQSVRSRVVLMDFGLVQKELDTELTQTGSIVGTPAFMSPEQANGWELDGRSDIYSLGATFYALLAGRSPYKGPKNLVLGRVAAKTPPTSLQSLRPELPEEVVKFVNTAMAGDREIRFPDASTMLKEVVRILRSPSPPAAKPTPAPKASAPPTPPKQEPRGDAAGTTLPPPVACHGHIPLELVDTAPFGKTSRQHSHSSNRSKRRAGEGERDTWRTARKPCGEHSPGGDCHSRNPRDGILDREPRKHVAEESGGLWVGAGEGRRPFRWIDGRHSERDRTSGRPRSSVAQSLRGLGRRSGRPRFVGADHRGMARGILHRAGPGVSNGQGMR